MTALAVSFGGNFVELYSPSAASGRDNDDDERSRRRPRLPRWLIDRAATLGFTRSMLLQRRALGVLLTGSGKTLAFLLPLLQRVVAG